MITRKILIAQLCRLNGKFWQFNNHANREWLCAAVTRDGIIDCGCHVSFASHPWSRIITINCHWHDRVPMMLEDDVCKAVGIPE